MSNRNVSSVLKQETHPSINIWMYHVFGSFKSTWLTLNGNITDVPLKYGIIYKSIGFLSTCHAATSCTVSFRQITEYQKKTLEIWNFWWMGWPQKNSLTGDLLIRNYLKIITTTSPEFITWKIKENHERFLLNYRKQKTERAQPEIKQKIMKIAVQTYLSPMKLF